MSKIRARKETGRLYLDFFYAGNRCRLQTLLDDTPANRKKAQKLADQIDFEIQSGIFDYQRYFPNSKRLAAVLGTQSIPTVALATVAANDAYDPIHGMGNRSGVGSGPQQPLFEDFANTWYQENEVSWRKSHRRTLRDIIDNRLIPEFGKKVVGQITKAEIMAFRSTLAKVPGRKNATLTAKSINAIMAPLRQILNEAADRFEFNTPFRNIKPLKIQKTDVEPFTLEEVQQILQHVRSDFKHYYTTRFFTGMRTGEIDGLKWQYVDFKNRLILVRETLIAGEEDYTKTDGSQREIQMSALVFEALTEQARLTKGKSKFVFTNRQGEPLDHNNVTKRVWYPLLRFLGLKQRRPYQTRHTAATLWLASGENPLWIARQLGHTSTEMLFKVYSRFVPNLTRQDGSAFERLLLQTGTVGMVGTNTPAANSSMNHSPSASNDEQTQTGGTNHG